VDPPPLPSKGWAEMIRRVYEVDPLFCSRCGGHLTACERGDRHLEEWEHTYNYVRPHQALDYLTPNEHYRRWKKIQKSQVSLMP
jgi:hypothetical protein